MESCTGGPQTVPARRPLPLARRHTAPHRNGAATYQASRIAAGICPSRRPPVETGGRSCGHLSATPEPSVPRRAHVAGAMAEGVRPPPSPAGLHSPPPPKYRWRPPGACLRPGKQPRGAQPKCRPAQISEPQGRRLPAAAIRYPTQRPSPGSQPLNQPGRPVSFCLGLRHPSLLLALRCCRSGSCRVFHYFLSWHGPVPLPGVCHCWRLPPGLLPQMTKASLISRAAPVARVAVAARRRPHPSCRAVPWGHPRAAPSLVSRRSSFHKSQDHCPPSCTRPRPDRRAATCRLPLWACSVPFRQAGRQTGSQDSALLGFLVAQKLVTGQMHPTGCPAGLCWPLKARI